MFSEGIKHILTLCFIVLLKKDLHFASIKFDLTDIIHTGYKDFIFTCFTFIFYNGPKLKKTHKQEEFIKVEEVYLSQNFTI